MNIEKLKNLRKQTEVGVTDAKRALIKADGDYDKALQALKDDGLLIAKKKAAKITKFSTIGYYIHTKRRIAVLVELWCESEIASQTEEFTNLADDIAMHIAAKNPHYISKSDVPKELVEQLQCEFLAQAKIENKPDSLIETIVDGKMKKFYQDNCLLEQRYYRDEEKSMQEVLIWSVYTLKENIEIKRFVRYETGKR